MPGLVPGLCQALKKLYLSFRVVILFYVQLAFTVLVQRPWKSTAISIFKGKTMSSDQPAFPRAPGEVRVFAGSRSAAVPMTCCAHTPRPSLPATRERSWTSCTWPCGISMAWRRSTELWESPSWSARYARRDAGGPAVGGRAGARPLSLAGNRTLLFRTLVSLVPGQLHFLSPPLLPCDSYMNFCPGMANTENELYL